VLAASASQEATRATNPKPCNMSNSARRAGAEPGPLVGLLGLDMYEDDDDDDVEGKSSEL